MPENHVLTALHPYRAQEWVYSAVPLTFPDKRLLHDAPDKSHPRRSAVMKSGFAYANVPIYRLVMRLLYGREYHRKYQAVADLIPSSSSVVDLCAGDCLLSPV